jgi:hypothetical protein
MSDIAVLKEMINPSATVPLEDYYDKKKVTLKELSAIDEYSVIIHGMPIDEQTIVIKADAFREPKEIFANSKHECKRADFIIVADTGRKKVIICIELKSGNGGSTKEIIRQLQGAQCLMAYCQKIGQLFWEHQNFLKDYEYRFVSIKNISVSKRPTRPAKKSIHDRPDQMLKVTSPMGLQFNQLVGG